MFAVLPRDAIPSTVYAVVVCPSVRPFVRHKPVLCRIDWTNRTGFWHGGFHLSHNVYKEIWISPQIRVVSGLENFATASRSRCPQNSSSSSSSTVELVDDTYTTLGRI